MKENEMIADIVAEKRNRADEIEKAAMNQANQFQRELITDLRREANRLEAAWKRGIVSRRSIKIQIEIMPKCNAAELREALVSFMQLSDDGVIQPRSVGGADEHCFCVLKKIARAALAAPPRNCDVGTAEEQSRRFCAFCRPRLEPCDGCPCLEGSRHGRCEFVWAQMPYESEVTK